MLFYTSCDDVTSKTQWGTPNVKFSFLDSRDGHVIPQYMKTQTKCIERARKPAPPRARRRGRARARCDLHAVLYKLRRCYIGNPMGEPNVKFSFLIPRGGHVIPQYTKTQAKCIARARKPAPPRARRRGRARARDAICTFCLTHCGMLHRKPNEENPM